MNGCSATIIAAVEPLWTATIRLAMTPARPHPLVTPFAHRLLAHDFPGLPDERREHTVEFIAMRIRTLPSLTRAGVLVIAALFRVLIVIPGNAAMMGAGRLPIFGEYVRLVRSLGYAYIWETWPATGTDGRPHSHGSPVVS